MNTIFIWIQVQIQPSKYWKPMVTEILSAFRRKKNCPLLGGVHQERFHSILHRLLKDIHYFLIYGEFLPRRLISQLFKVFNPQRPLHFRFNI